MTNPNDPRNSEPLTPMEHADERRAFVEEQEEAEDGDDAIFQLVQLVDKRLLSDLFDPAEGRDPMTAFSIRGFHFAGPTTNNRLRAELRDRPRFTGLCGPMWGGLSDDGRPIIRYETQDAYNVLSA